jgi:hypothetical protein
VILKFKVKKRQSVENTKSVLKKTSISRTKTEKKSESESNGEAFPVLN